MFVVANFLDATATVLDVVLWLYMWIVIARAVISWVNPDPYNPIVRFLYSATEPLLYRVRRVLPMFGGIDFSPLIVILAIVFLQTFLVKSLRDLATAFP
jgi:YggT family protein